jgi:hypothetical protein
MVPELIAISMLGSYNSAFPTRRLQWLVAKSDPDQTSRALNRPNYLVRDFQARNRQSPLDPFKTLTNEIKLPDLLGMKE